MNSQEINEGIKILNGIYMTMLTTLQFWYSPICTNKTNLLKNSAYHEINMFVRGVLYSIQTFISQQYSYQILVEISPSAKYAKLSTSVSQLYCCSSTFSKSFSPDLFDYENGL